jgi:hypothetical protein
MLHGELLQLAGMSHPQPTEILSFEQWRRRWNRYLNTSILRTHNAQTHIYVDRVLNDPSFGVKTSPHCRCDHHIFAAEDPPTTKCPMRGCKGTKSSAREVFYFSIAEQVSRHCQSLYKYEGSVYICTLPSCDRCTRILRSLSF